MSKEYKVGEKIKLGNVTLLVEKAESWDCGKCFFYKICNSNLFYEVERIIGECVPNYREDKNNVIFIEVKEE